MKKLLGIVETNTLDAVTKGYVDTAIAGSGGSGDVVGPASATDNAIARFDSTTGKLVQNSAVTVDDGGNINTNSGDVYASGGTVTGTQVTGSTILANLSLSTNVINERITAAGVTIDGVLLKDNFIAASAVPTLNQSTTGSAATLTTARTFQTDLASNTAVSFNASANNVHGVTGTLPTANGGTSSTTATGTGSNVLSVSPALSGTPTAPTATAGTNTTQVATTAGIVAERTATATLTGKTISGSSNTITNIPMSALPIKSGYSYMLGNNAAGMSMTVNYPSSFSTTPNVVVSFAGYTSGGAPSSNASNSVDNQAYTVSAQGINTTGFTLCFNRASSTYSSSFYYIANWIACI